jgi:pantoate--beta-alanine ligase
MHTIHSAAALAPFHHGVLVPTMGALHEGHGSLVRRARAIADATPGRPPVVVTIFVNPTQFNDPADLTRYPRTPDADLALCAAAGADAVFMPGVAEIYPSDAPVRVPPLPPVATEPGLEDRWRPGHFAGVCQVVLRLFELTRPSIACFGEKDWQQLRVVAAMTAALALPIRIDPVPTVREPDGLAMSSRNRFLAPDDRVRARAVPSALAAAARASTPRAGETAMAAALTEAGLMVEYAVVRAADTLLPVPPAQVRYDAPLRALIAARCGPVRLIDNGAWSAPPIR